MRINKKKAAAVVAAAAIGLAGAGVAVAYWTTSGSGSGSGATGSDTGVTVNQTSTNSAADLYPGASVALSGNFDNPGPSKQYVGSVTASVDTFSVQTDANKPACTQDDFMITGTSTLPGELAVGTGVGSWSGLSLHMIDAGTNQDNCKGLTTSDLTITYSANPS